jgi:hypothetical protein
MLLFGNLNWKSLLLLLAVVATLSTSALAGGGTSAGGGDLCEDRIKVIRDDLLDWIQQGGPDALTLPAEVSVKQYSNGMLKAIRNAKIQCIGPHDRGYPVNVNGTPKICRFDQNAAGSRIICDFQKFRSLSGSDRYVLIHHEYAGLSGIEQPNGDDSNYEVSNQISEFLENNRLNVKISQGTPFNGCYSVSDTFVECTFSVFYDYKNARDLKPVTEEFYSQYTVRVSKDDESFCKIWDANNSDNSVPCKKIQRSNHSADIASHSFSVVSKPDYLARVLKENFLPTPIGNRVIEILISSMTSAKRGMFNIDFSCVWYFGRDNVLCDIPSTTVSAPDSSGETVTLIFHTKAKTLH